MGFLVWFALTLAAFALLFCVYLWLELQKRVLKGEVTPLLRSSCDELKQDYAREVRGIATEWDDMYQKFSRLAGRMDREKRPAPEPEQVAPVEEPKHTTRSDILRQYRGRRSNV